jgi:hypothetical protein
LGYRPSSRDTFSVRLLQSLTQTSALYVPSPLLATSIVVDIFPAVNYRKCLTAETAFPAPLQDALAGYLYLKGLGFLPENITFIGDSSGAHIMLGLVRYLSETTSKELGLGIPGSLILISVRSDILPVRRKNAR